jgi:hypothetical protein
MTDLPRTTSKDNATPQVVYPCFSPALDPCNLFMFSGFCISRHCLSSAITPDHPENEGLSAPDPPVHCPVIRCSATSSATSLMNAFPSLLIAAAAFAFAACNRNEPAVVVVPPPPAVDETKVAVDSFRKEVDSIQQWLSAKTKEAAGNPLSMLGSIRELGDRIRRVPTEKLPTDLREAFTGFTSSFSDAGSFLKEAPSKPEEMIPFLLKTAQDPAFMEKMKKLLTAGGTAAVRLREVAARYGIENLDLSPGSMGGLKLPGLDSPGEGKTPGESLPQ